MASPVAERRPAPVAAPAAPKPSPVSAPAPAPAAGGTLAAQARQLDAAAGPRVKLGPDASPGETVALRGSGTFAPPEAVAKRLAGHRGGAAVNVAFEGIGAGPIQVFEHKGQYATGELQAIPIFHPALDSLRTVKLEPVLAIAIAKSEVSGYVTIAHGGKPVQSPRSVLAGILGSAGPLGAAGLSKLEPSGKYVNALADGKLTLSTDLAVTIGGYFHGSGTFGLADDVVTFNAEATASVGKTKLNLSAARDEKGAISGRGSGEVALEHFQGSFVVNYAGGVVEAAATAKYSTEKFEGSVTLIVTDAKTADSVAYSHLPPDKIAAAGLDAAGGAPGAVTPGTATPKPGPRAIAGWGTLDAHFNDWLTGKALVIVDSQGHVTVIGEITPPAVVTFDKTKLDVTKRIFKFEVQAGYGIPVVGEIFVFFSLSLDAIARISPLTLSKIRIAGTYSTNPEIPKDFSISANLSISAMAGLQLEAAAGAGLEVMEHELKIGAAVTALAGIKAYINAIPSIEYLETADPREGKRGDFHIHGAAEIAGQPFLDLGGKLFVAIETPWWSPLSDHTWEWPLGTLEYLLPGEFGLGADVDYVLGSANPPAISFKSVDFSAERFAGDLMDEKVPTGHAGDQQKAGAWKEKVPAKPPPPPPPPAAPKLKSSKGKPPAKNTAAVKQDGKAQQEGAKALEDLRKRSTAKPLPAGAIPGELGEIERKHGFKTQTKKVGDAIEVTGGAGRNKLKKPVKLPVAKGSKTTDLDVESELVMDDELHHLSTHIVDGKPKVMLASETPRDLQLIVQDVLGLGLPKSLETVLKQIYADIVALVKLEQAALASGRPADIQAVRSRQASLVRSLVTLGRKGVGDFADLHRRGPRAPFSYTGDFNRNGEFRTTTVEAHPVVAGGEESPVGDPSGWGRLNKSAQWVRAHLVSSRLGGPRDPRNLVPTPKDVNNNMFLSHERDLIKQLVEKPGWETRMIVAVSYYGKNMVASTLGRQDDFAMELRVTTITKMGKKSREHAYPPYAVRLPYYYEVLASRRDA